MSLTLSSRGFCLSRTSISVLILSSSASFSKSRASAAARSLGEVFSSSMTRFSSAILVSSSSASCSSSSSGLRVSSFALSSFRCWSSSPVSCRSWSPSSCILLYYVMSFCCCEICFCMVFFLASSALFSSLRFCIASVSSGPWASSSSLFCSSTSRISLVRESMSRLSFCFSSAFCSSCFFCFYFATSAASFLAFSCLKPSICSSIDFPSRFLIS